MVMVMVVVMVMVMVFRLKQLKDVNNRREAALFSSRGENPLGQQAQRFRDWIRSERDTGRFKQTVYGPIALDVKSHHHHHHRHCHHHHHRHRHNHCIMMTIMIFSACFF